MRGIEIEREKEFDSARKRKEKTSSGKKRAGRESNRRKQSLDRSFKAFSRINVEDVAGGGL